MERSVSQVKGVLLYSGGLDSLIAARLLMDQGISLTGLHCILPYYPPDQNADDMKQTKLAKQIGLELVHYRCGNEYIEMLKKPAHGYGKEINPCIDCKIFFLRRAAELMGDLKADFVATGEVAGQRPMSQLKHTLIHIEKESGLTGRLIRPLSAKIFKPSVPELEGLVDRDRLLDINGRGRKRQMELAAFYGITDYELPAGGCLFTDKTIAALIRDAFNKEKNVSQLDLFLLKTGRHLRLTDDLKIIVSRNKAETEELEKYTGFSDFFFKPEFSGPSVYARGLMTGHDLQVILAIITFYGKASKEENLITVYQKNVQIKKIPALETISQEEIDRMRI